MYAYGEVQGPRKGEFPISLFFWGPPRGDGPVPGSLPSASLEHSGRVARQDCIARVRCHVLPHHKRAIAWSQGCRAEPIAPPNGGKQLKIDENIAQTMKKTMKHNEHICFHLCFCFFLEFFYVVSKTNFLTVSPNINSKPFSPIT